MDDDQRKADEKIMIYFAGFHNAVFNTDIQQPDQKEVSALTKVLNMGLERADILSIDDDTDGEIEEKAEKTERFYTDLFAKLANAPIDKLEDGADEVLFLRFKDWYYSLLAYIWAFIGKLDYDFGRHQKGDLSTGAIHLAALHERLIENTYDDFDNNRRGFLQYAADLYHENEEIFNAFR